MSEHQTEHFQIDKPDPYGKISEDFYRLIVAFDKIDAILQDHRQALAKTATDEHQHKIDDIQELREALDNLMPKDQKIKLAELSDVLGVENARVNYILTKTALGFAFQSALSVLGTHEHLLADIIGLQDVLNTFVSGPAGSTDGEIPVYQGTSGKGIKGSGTKLSDLLQTLADKVGSSAFMQALNDMSSNMTQGLNGKQDKLNYTPLDKAGDTATNLKTTTTPTANDHVARKDYVDSAVEGVVSTVAAGSVHNPIAMTGTSLRIPVNMSTVTILAKGRVTLYATFVGNVTQKRRLQLHRVNANGSFTLIQDSGEKTGGTAATINIQVDVNYGDTFRLMETLQDGNPGGISVRSNKNIPVIIGGAL